MLGVVPQACSPALKELRQEDAKSEVTLGWIAKYPVKNKRNNSKNKEKKIPFQPVLDTVSSFLCNRVLKMALILEFVFFFFCHALLKNYICVFTYYLFSMCMCTYMFLNGYPTFHWT